MIKWGNVVKTWVDKGSMNSRFCFCFCFFVVVVRYKRESRDAGIKQTL